jgi:mycoredoxin
MDGADQSRPDQSGATPEAAGVVDQQALGISRSVHAINQVDLETEHDSAVQRRAICAPGGLGVNYALANRAQAPIRWPWEPEQSKEVVMAKSYPEVTLYTRPWCGSVMRVKRWLDQRGIPYTEINIVNDKEAARHVEELNGGNQSVPTILFDGEHVATEPSTQELEHLFT